MNSSSALEVAYDHRDFAVGPSTMSSSSLNGALAFLP